MFHPDFFRTGLFPFNERTLTTAMQLASAFQVDEEMQDKWREEREREIQAEIERRTGKRGRKMW
jgi:hypothetical protein